MLQDITRRISSVDNSCRELDHTGVIDVAVIRDD